MAEKGIHLIAHVNQLTAPPIIGRYYLVPCVLMPDKNGAADLMPIFGDSHDDREIGATFEHWHFDFRFFSQRQLRRHGRPLYAMVAKVEFSIGRTVRRLKCKRQFPEWPGLDERREWGTTGEAFLRRVQSLCAGRKLCGMRCPHKGFDLSSIPADEKGIVTCPGHGLRFNLKTGAQA